MNSVSSLLQRKDSVGSVCLEVVRPCGCAEVHTTVFLEVGDSPEDGAAVVARVDDVTVTPV